MLRHSCCKSPSDHQRPVKFALGEASQPGDAGGFVISPNPVSQERDAAHPAGDGRRPEPIGGLNRVGVRQMLATLGRLPMATFASNRSVRGVAAVFSMGGYAAGPPVLAAILRRVPVVVMEPNAVPGFTNRSIGRLVARALVSFPETASFFPRGRTEVLDGKGCHGGRQWAGNDSDT